MQRLYDLQRIRGLDTITPDIEAEARAYAMELTFKKDNRLAKWVQKIKLLSNYQRKANEVAKWEVLAARGIPYIQKGAG